MSATTEKPAAAAFDEGALAHDIGEIEWALRQIVRASEFLGDEAVEVRSTGHEGIADRLDFLNAAIFVFGVEATKAIAVIRKRHLPRWQ